MSALVPIGRKIRVLPAMIAVLRGILQFIVGLPNEINLKRLILTNATKGAIEEVWRPLSANVSPAQTGRQKSEAQTFRKGKNKVIRRRRTSRANRIPERPNRVHRVRINRTNKARAADAVYKRFFLVG